MKQTALITGASAGIGYELAKIFAREGFDLVLAARRKEKLEALAAALKSSHGTQTNIFQKDLSQSGAARELFDEISGRGLQIDILVNNAGVGVYGLFRETDTRTELAMLQLNILSLTHLTKLVLPGMLQRGKGKILNLASTAAFQPGPYMAAYYASKAYVLSFSEALNAELQGTGVTVSALCPGPTDSEFQETAKIDRKITLFKLTMMSSGQVAEKGFRGLMQNKAVIIPGFVNAFGAFMVRFSPRRWLTAIVTFIQKRKAEASVS